MKTVLASIALMTLTSTASASMITYLPDFEMETQYEKSVIAESKAVRRYVQDLGAFEFTVTNGKPGLDLYAVVTSNGCSFDVRVVYTDWPGVDQVMVYHNAVCE